MASETVLNLKNPTFSPFLNTMKTFVSSVPMIHGLNPLCRSAPLTIPLGAAALHPCQHHKLQHCHRVRHRSILSNIIKVPQELASLNIRSITHQLAMTWVRRTKPMPWRCQITKRTSRAWLSLYLEATRLAICSVENNLGKLHHSSRRAHLMTTTCLSTKMRTDLKNIIIVA